MAERRKRLKMSNAKFRALLIVPLALLVIVAVALTVAGALLKTTFDTYLGGGDSYIEAPSETSDWDATYYDVELIGEGDAS